MRFYAIYIYSSLFEEKSEVYPLLNEVNYYINTKVYFYNFLIQNLLKTRKTQENNQLIRSFLL